MSCLKNECDSKAPIESDILYQLNMFPADHQSAQLLATKDEVIIIPSLAMKFIDTDHPSLLRYTERSLCESSSSDQSKHTARQAVTMISDKTRFNDDVNRPVVLDLSAGVGSVTIEFARAGFNVISIDNDPSTVAFLRNNITVSLTHTEQSRVHIYLMNCIDYIKTLLSPKKNAPKIDIVFIDAPWGGIYYKRNRKVTLNYTHTDIETLIKDTYHIDDLIRMLSIKCSTIIIKAPINHSFHIYNFKHLFLNACVSLYTPNLKQRTIYKMVFISNNPTHEIERVVYVPRIKYRGILSEKPNLSNCADWPFRSRLYSIKPVIKKIV